MKYVKINFDDYKVELVIFRVGKSILFKMKGMVVPLEINNDTIKFLKENITFPIKMQCIGLSRAQIGKVVGEIKSNQTNVFFNKNKIQNNNNIESLLCYDVLFINEKQIKYQNSEQILKVKQKQKIK
jgi:hypothetical protein